MNLTYKDHFKFGYNDQWFNFRTSPKDVWKVTYGRCERDPLDFRDECIETAKLIRQNTDLPINILLSGGVDSEVIVRSFLDANIKVNCIIGDMCGYNQHDIEYAIDFCNEHDVSFDIVYLDIKKFWKESLHRISKETNCISPQFPAIMNISDQVAGYNIIGVGECFLRQHTTWQMYEREKVASLYKYYILNDKTGAPGFFQYTPELMLSFLEHKRIKEITSSDTYTVKPQIYKDMWPDIKIRKKYNGFEKIHDLCESYRNELIELNPNADSIVMTDYSQLINMLVPIDVEEISKDEIMKYQFLYKSNGVSLFDTPFKNQVVSSRYFSARVRGRLAGLTSYDVLENGQLYQHGALTVEKFRNMGVNNITWKYKMNEIAKFATYDTELIAVHPEWIEGAVIMANKLKRIGFKLAGHRPDGAPIHTCKFRELKHE